MLTVPMAPNTVTASPATPRRSASGAHGERSSHSPNTMPATRPGCPHTLWDVKPIRWPATLRITRRRARPMAGERCPSAPPRQPAPKGMPSWWR